MSALSNLKKSIATFDAAWEESSHKRAANGQFGSGGAASKTTATQKTNPAIAKAQTASEKAKKLDNEPTKSGSGSEFGNQHVKRMAAHKTAEGAHMAAAAKAKDPKEKAHHEKQSEYHTQRYNTLQAHPNTNSAISNYKK